MKLSKNFTLTELTKSNTAKKWGIKNIPNNVEIDKMVVLCTTILQPIRDFYNQSVRVSSGFRCIELNRKLGSKDISKHTMGCAADIEIFGVDNLALAEQIVKMDLPFDKIVLEYYNGEPNSGWIHVQIDPNGNNRKAIQTINNDGNFYGKFVIEN